MRDIRRSVHNPIPARTPHPTGVVLRQQPRLSSLIRPVTSVRPARPSHLRRRSRTILIGLLLLAGLATAGWWLKQTLTEAGNSALMETKAAVQSARQGDLEQSRLHLDRAEQAFSRGAHWLRPFAWLPSSFGRVPGFAHGISAEALFRAGEEGTRAAHSILSVLPTLLIAPDAPGGIVPMIELLGHSAAAAAEAHTHLSAVESAFERVRPSALPEAVRSDFARIHEALPIATALLAGYVEHQALFAELLGVNGPRVYLFLFQNNHELRATGGFIGSYALLDVNQGHIRRFFVDGIFNPDGQLKENIVPPKPIQKISAGWSLHDSNWFPNFPTSAEKAIFFYEKTGGPTVDGIITLTPEVLERILTLVGPVTLPEYGVTIDAENYMPIIQEEVEVKYDKEENEPKRILGDLTEVLLRRFLSFDHPQETWGLGTTLAALLNEKHILLYSRHPDIQALISGAGWSGEMLSASHDYLSVIHTNINGYKTDGVIDETISHEAEIRADGTVRDTVTITRQHKGGNTAYDWWNKVNADYCRVYVPKDSTLVSAEGMTREFPKAPIDYLALGFRQDPDIVSEEEGTVQDELSGTRMSEDAGKTVFGNWVYVSPGESVTLRYVYDLPFRVRLEGDIDDPTTAYAALYQKQSGTDGALLTATIRYPQRLRPVWQTPENLIPYQRVFETKQTLKRDFYWGVVFGRNDLSGE
ncbi:MAG: DUF4012 domain-containing protein [Candidatus Moraniibacteriota bacterium]